MYISVNSGGHRTYRSDARSVFDSELCQPYDNVNTDLFILQGCVGPLMVTVTMTLLVDVCRLNGSKTGGRWLVCMYVCMYVYICVCVCVCM